MFKTCALFLMLISLAGFSLSSDAATWNALNNSKSTTPVLLSQVSSDTNTVIQDDDAAADIDTDSLMSANEDTN
jgi:hypothetical protein